MTVTQNLYQTHRTHGYIFESNIFTLQNI